MNIFHKLKNLILFPISLTLSDSCRVEGYIVDVKGDYIQIEYKGSISMYIPIKSIRDIKLKTKSDVLSNTNVARVKHLYFKDYLQSVKQNWLCIKRANLDDLEGILVALHDEYALFVQDEYIVTLPLSEIVAVQEGKDVQQVTNTSNVNDQDQNTESEQNEVNEEKSIESTETDAEVVIMQNEQETLEMISNEEEQPDSQDAKEDLVISLTNTEKDTEKVENTAEVEEQIKSIIETTEMEYVESKTKEVNQIEMEQVASVIHEDNSVEKKPLDSITNDIKPSERNPLEPNQQDSIIIEDSQDEVKDPLLIKEQHPVEVEKVESVHEEILNTSEAQLTDNEDGEKTFDLVIHQSDPNKVMEVDPETDVIDNRIQAQESKKGTNFEVLDWMENRLSDSYDEDIYIEEYLDFHGFGDNGAKNERDKVSKGRYRNWNGSSDEDYNNPSTRVLYIIQNWHQHS